MQLEEVFVCSVDIQEKKKAACPLNKDNEKVPFLIRVI